MRRAVLFGILLSLSAAVHARTLGEILARLEQSEKDVQRLSFHFTQTTRIALTGESVRAQGAAAFERPDRFRVEQKSPTRQTVVSDGKNLWLSLPDQGQVMRDSVENWSRSAGFPQGLTPFRMDVSALKEKYAITLESGGKVPVLRLAPSGPGALPYTLRLWVDMATGLPVKTELASASVSAVTEVQDAQVNPAFTADTFTFNAPAGSRVIDLPVERKTP